MSLIVPVEAGPPPEGSLAGRVLMLNTEKAVRFQCFGFAVSRNNPIQIVPARHSDSHLRAGLAEGKLLDVTGREDIGTAGKIVKDIDRAVQDGTLTPKAPEKVGLAVLIGRDKAGNSYVMIPKDEEDYQRMLAEIEANGSIRVPKQEMQYTGLSPIYQKEVIPPPESQQTES